MHEMPPDLPISHWTVLLLRAREQHAVAHSAQNDSFGFLYSMELQALNNDAALKDALDCDCIIVTSPAAARFASRSPVFFTRPDTRWFVLGQGTANELEKLGVDRISRPESNGDSESLLAMQELQSLHGRDIGLLTAPGGRGLIEPSLIERGARVHTVHVYQRVPAIIEAPVLQALHKLKPPVAILCSSYEVFLSFWQQADASLREKLRQDFWIVSSLRLRNLLQETGISNVAVSYSAKPETMLAQLRHVQTQQVR